MRSKHVGLLLTVVMLVLTFDCGNCNRQEIGKVVSIRSNAVTRVKDSASILNRDSRSIHRYRRYVLNSSEIQEAIDVHNRLRRLERASDMEIMIWDNDLATQAKISAEKCIWNHTNTGQNLYATDNPSGIDLTDAIQAWYDEKPYYNNFYITGICLEPGGQCLHYSQVVWATSRKLGCAYTRCATLQLTNFPNALFLVCNYDPPGNVVGKMPFQNGAECSRCASWSWWCNNGLCDQSCTSDGQTCACTAACSNHGYVNSATCSCSCAPGWYGSDCSVVCGDLDPLCDPQPGQYGYLLDFCSDSKSGPQIQKLCPRMCGKCQVVSGVCKDYDPRCNPKPGDYGWPPFYCNDSNYGATVKTKCPAMCNQCQGVCEDYDSRCNPLPGEYGWPPSYCNHSQYGAATRRFCPAMCKTCQAIASNLSTSTKKTLLLTLLAVWLSHTA